MGIVIRHTRAERFGTRHAEGEIYIYTRFIVPFPDRAGLPLHNIPSSGGLMKSIGAEFL